MKKVVVISSSLRQNSNSEAFAKAFAEGASSAGHKVEFVSLIGKKMGFCIGCLACQNSGECVIKDDAIQIAESLKNADVAAFATPVYYYGMSGQLKTLLDRCNSLFSSHYSFRDIYLLTAAAENDESAMDGTATQLQGWIDCFSGVRLAGEVRGIGLTDAGEAAQRGDLLNQAFELGRQI